MGVLKSKPVEPPVGRSGPAESSIPKGTTLTSFLNLPEVKGIKVQASTAVVEKKPNISSSENLSKTQSSRVRKPNRSVTENNPSPMTKNSEHASHLQLSDVISSRFEVDMPSKRIEETVNQGMCEYVIQHDIRLGLDANFDLADETGSTKLPAMLVFSLAIKCLMEHALQYIKDKRRNIDESSILWALTVPAIWNEAETQFMKDAAVKAGIKREKLKIVFEPEAASFACRYLPINMLNQRKYKPCFSEVPIGTLYMVVDLGGGTADIVIHKKIDPIRVKEISRPSGGPWGGTKVDSNFVNFIIKIVGEKAFMIFKRNFPEGYVELMQEFEVKKRSVEHDMKKKVHFKLPVSLLTICQKEAQKDLEEIVQQTEYSDKMQFVGDKVLIDPEIFYSFFEPVAKDIVEHVKCILGTRQGSHVALLLMVGGLSESKYIQKIMKREFQSDTMDVLIPDDPGVSVIKGAIVFAREEKLLAFRIRDVTCVAALHIGRNKTSMAIQFRNNFKEDPNKVSGVTFQGPNGDQTMYDSACVLIDQAMNINCVGNQAEEKYKQLCDTSMGKEKEWHFFKDFLLQLEEQEDNIELILRDQENIQIKAIDILKIYISHGLNHLKNIFLKRGGYELMRETHFVFTAPASWAERASIRLISDAAEMAGLKEERISIVLESEAINQYCKINKHWNNLNIADAPIGSIVVIANLTEEKGDLTFHEKKSIGAVSGAYKTVSGPWGTKSLSDEFMHYDYSRHGPSRAI